MTKPPETPQHGDKTQTNAKPDRCDYCRTPITKTRKHDRFCKNNGKCRKLFHRYGGLNIGKLYDRLGPMVRREVRSLVREEFEKLRKTAA